MQWRWWHDAACQFLDPRLFDSDQFAKTALTICNACTVKMECLQAALDEEFSQHNSGVLTIRGGMTAKQRAIMYKGIDPERNWHIWSSRSNP